jgi:hypothetical protein
MDYKEEYVYTIPIEDKVYRYCKPSVLDGKNKDVITSAAFILNKERNHKSLSLVWYEGLTTPSLKNVKNYLAPKFVNGLKTKGAFSSSIVENIINIKEYDLEVKSSEEDKVHAQILGIYELDDAEQLFIANTLAFIFSFEKHIEDIS